SPLVSITGWQGLGEHTLHRRTCLTRGIAWRRLAVHVRGEIDVVVEHAIGAGDKADLRNGADRHGIASRIARLQIGDVFRARAESRLGLRIDAEGAAE